VTDEATNAQPEGGLTIAAASFIQQALQAAITEGGSALQAVDKILEIQRRYDDDRMRGEFNGRLRRIQTTMKRVVRKGHNTQTNSKYAEIDAVDAVLKPLLDKEGMVMTFEPSISDKPNTVVITAVLAMGQYERRYPIEMPTDGSGPKGGAVMTRTHATGSAMTYARRYLKQMIFDMQFGLKDDDGNAAGGSKPGRLPDPERLDWENRIRESNNRAELQNQYVDAIKAAEGAADGESVRVFIALKNERLAKLNSQGGK
jgi:hypothetical protein